MATKKPAAVMRSTKGVDTHRPKGIVERVQASVDPLGWAPATLGTLRRAATNPAGLASAGVRAATGAAVLPLATLLRAVDLPGPTPIDCSKDARFKDQAWQENPYFFAVHQSYALLARLLDDVLAAGRSGGIDDAKVALLARLIVDALSPTNFLATNPEALVAAFRTGGKSLAKGAALALDDIGHRNGLPQKSDPAAFELGKNMAATPGSVVYRNDLIEVIQYAPQTETVHERPILCSPPWINKYYVMDLAPNRSLVEWAVQHNRTVFMISYRNPDETMRTVTFDEYLDKGILRALDVVTDITGQDVVDVVGLCLGGAIASMAVANLAARGEDRVGSLTLLNTMLDYTNPGELAGFVDPPTLERIALRMEQSGFLESTEMALTFDLLRSRDLIFRYIPQRWLLGEKAKPFDILAWNDDSTRMPAAMHAAYLRSIYGENQLAKGDFSLGGERLDLGEVHADTYVVGAINDHIVPWKSSYASTHLLGGKVRYVLSSGGHIAGVVNPPSPKAWYEATELPVSYPDSADQWRSATDRHAGSWWDDWTNWSSSRAGELVEPPPMGSDTYRAGDPAPGSYVHS
ncbi:PHA/PHB synthase family protein [Millisia brevis]|uniref:PHA/PHB synthase family protein n=1 Tax=Millisia brevis TaxID=264148 RepID=UPI000ADE67A5|nr:alpha/beta fold hydrolase [Millisia brevis]